MSRPLFILLGWLLACCAQAAEVQVSAGASWPLAVADHAMALEAADPDLQLADLRALDRDGVLQPLAGKPLKLGSSAQVAWLRLNLRNTEAAPLPLRLVLGDTRVRRVDFYVLLDGAIQHSETGSGVALAAQTWPGRDAGVELTLPAHGAATVYARVRNTHAAGLTPKLYSPTAYTKREQRAALWDGALLGGLMALGWAGLLIAIFSRSLAFLWLAVLCVNITLFEATYRGYSQLYLWPGATDWGERATQAVGLTTSVFFALFVLGVAKHENIRLPLHRLFIAAAGIQGGLALLAAIGLYPLVAGIGLYASPLYYILGLIMALFLLRRTAPSGRLMVIVMGFALCNISLRKAEALGLAPEAILQLGLDIHPNPIVALVGLATNLAVLAAWIHQVGAQRAAARVELANWQQREQERLLAEVERQTRALNQALAYAEEKNRQQVQMLGYITHDLRAPLANIAGHARTLEQTVAPAREHHVQAIDRSVRYQLALIDDLLEFTRAELHPLRIAPSRTDLAALLNDIGDYAATLATVRGNRYLTERRGVLPAHVQLDARRLQQVLLNLISNAAKYTHTGDIRLRVEAEPEDAGWRLRFAVADTGIGISLPQQTRVFEAFKQIQNAHGGVGLGLYIAQRIVESMGSTLRVRSAAGQGSTFSFDILAGAAGTATLAPGVTACAQQPAPAPPAAADASAPAHLRTELAVLAHDGRLSDIEAWLAEHAGRLPQYRTFFREVETLLQALDFERIERLALEARA